MTKIKLYLSAARCSQWIKNLVVFLPLFFGASILEIELVIKALLAFIAFSFAASTVYIINDLKDIDEDRAHKLKRHRPLASGKMQPKEAYLLILIFLLLLVLVVFATSSGTHALIICIYLILNLAYTFRLKRIPYLEILLVASFYILRLFGGGVVSGIHVSIWLFIVIFTGALLFVVGKRYTEKRYSKSRTVLDSYSLPTLEFLLRATAILSAIFLTIYALIQGVYYLPQALIYIAVLIRYLHLVKTTELGESATIFLDKILFGLIILFSCYSFLIIYLVN